MKHIRCLSWLPSFRRYDKSISYSIQLLKAPQRLFSESVNGESPAAVPPLFDTHGRKHDYLRISLTERCNLRCQYCMPAEGVPLSARSALVSRAELSRLVRVLAAAGVRKLRLTGGEPTLRADLADVVRELAAVPGIAAVAMTTNALVLTRRLPALQRAGLSAINVSLDTLRPDRYERMARRPGLARVLAGIDLALQLGYRPLKINTVLMRGFNDDEILDFVELTRDKEIEVRFIEFMPFSGNRWDASTLVPSREVVARVQEAHPALAREETRPHDTARVWRVPGHAGRLGLISSMTEHFCGSCNRLRLTADGSLKVCLFGGAELSLRDRARAGASDADLLRDVRAALRHKRARHAAAGARGYCTSFSHLDAAGHARMVDVGDKPVTRRAATAQCRVAVGARLLRLLRDARLPKGDAAAVARVAGVAAAKRAADLIPLCHPLPLSAVSVGVQLPAGAGAAGGDVLVTCSVRVEARTGAEMEALTGCAVAALALYDMCKAVDRDMRITDLRLVHKSGGRSDAAPPPAAAAPPAEPRAAAAAAPRDADATETYAPTNFMNF